MVDAIPYCPRILGPLVPCESPALENLGPSRDGLDLVHIIYLKQTRKSLHLPTLGRSVGDRSLHRWCIRELLLSENGRNRIHFNGDRSLVPGSRKLPHSKRSPVTVLDAVFASSPVCPKQVVSLLRGMALISELL